MDGRGGRDHQGQPGPVGSTQNHTRQQGTAWQEQLGAPGQPEQPESGLEVFFVKLPACQNLWFAQCRAMEIGPKVSIVAPDRPGNGLELTRKAYPESEYGWTYAADC